MQSQTIVISLSHALAMLVLDNNMADIFYDAYTHTRAIVLWACWILSETTQL